ncbi:DUF3574 domain-containing protein [Amycolatopsis dendrobii]|uniref:DUF3574 domain-containing protein n=1 Tax=Amycolatopsis dendrobii TaxID=2760662 RepID=A0A7W3W2R5_9PSEU|nr:DUF3574 domain-containing protein [Amycolatopsis dendrobii]MBB1157801.1 DUF3574 domain-containing protein [Amycolatopsis dendrobii]
MRFSRRFVLTTAAAMVLGGGVTAASAATTASPDSSLWKRTELYFGTAKPNGGEVTEKEFADFSAKDITPRFPDGFTQLEGTGQWRSGGGEVVREHSIVLVVLYPPTNQHANEDLEQIRTDYKHLFDQESVLRTDSTARVSF